MSDDLIIVHQREAQEFLAPFDPDDPAIWHTECGYDEYDGRSPRHPQVELRVGARHAWIDEDIVELIRAMWERDIDTQMSCQANMDDRIWIEFASSVDAERFVNLLNLGKDLNDDPLISHAIDTIDHHGDTYDRDFKWWWSLDTLSFAGAPPHTGMWHELHVSVRFPRQDLDEVVKRLNGVFLDEDPEGSPDEQVDHV